MLCFTTSLDNHSEIVQLIQDFARDLGDNINIEDLFPVIICLLKEIKLDLVHGHEENLRAFQQVVNELGGEIQERLNSGK
jgi:hypothetical protein